MDPAEDRTFDVFNGEDRYLISLRVMGREEIEIAGRRHQRSRSGRRSEALRHRREKRAQGVSLALRRRRTRSPQGGERGSSRLDQRAAHRLLPGGHGEGATARSIDGSGGRWHEASTAARRAVSRRSPNQGQAPAARHHGPRKGLRGLGAARRSASPLADLNRCASIPVAPHPHPPVVASGERLSTRCLCTILSPIAGETRQVSANPAAQEQPAAREAGVVCVSCRSSTGVQLEWAGRRFVEPLPGRRARVVRGSHPEGQVARARRTSATGATLPPGLADGLTLRSARARGNVESPGRGTRAAVPTAQPKPRQSGVTICGSGIDENWLKPIRPSARSLAAE
jgi:hypothetical protein